MKRLVVAFGLVMVPVMAAAQTQTFDDAQKVT